MAWAEQLQNGRILAVEQTSAGQVAQVWVAPLSRAVGLAGLLAGLLAGPRAVSEQKSQGKQPALAQQARVPEKLSAEQMKCWQYEAALQAE